MTRHKHADVIIAWANGAQIEYRSDNRSCWISITQPQWMVDYEYRVKQDPVEKFYDNYNINMYGQDSLACIPFYRLNEAAQNVWKTRYEQFKKFFEENA